MVIMAVVIMLMLVMIVFAMVIMAVVIMLMLVMIVMPMIIMAFIFMAMRVKGAAFTEFKLDQTVTIHQRDRFRVCRDALDRFFKKCLKIVAHPEHKVCVLEFAGLRRLQSVGVWRTGTFNQKRWFTDPFHHRGDKRVNRLDRGNHIDIGLRHGGAGRKNGGGQKCGSDKAHHLSPVRKKGLLASAVIL